MSASKLSEQPDQWSVATAYVFLLSRMGREIPADWRDAKDKARYADRAWVWALHKEACRECSDLPWSLKAWQHVLSWLSLNPWTVWRFCLLDDLVTIIAEEKRLDEALKACNAAVYSAKGLLTELERQFDEAERRKNCQAQEALRKKMDCAVDLRQITAAQKRSVLEAQKAMEDLKLEVLEDYYGIDDREAVQVKFVYLDKDNLNRAAVLRTGIEEACPRHLVGGYGKISSYIHYHHEQMKMLRESQHSIMKTFEDLKD